MTEFQFWLLAACLLSAIFGFLVGAQVFPKKKRIVNKAVLKAVSEMKCVVCGNPPPNDPHHLTTVGAGGDDTFANVFPFCRPCHSLWHQKGPAAVLAKSPILVAQLVGMGRMDILERAGLKYDQ